MIKNFYFVRHGRTDWNVGKIIQGQTDKKFGYDIPLNVEGMIQAKTLIDIIKPKNLEVIFSSPLLRALQTGAIVANALNIPIIISDGMREMYFGDKWEGMPVSEFEKLNLEIGITGKEYRKKHKSVNPEFDNLLHLGGETKIQVRERGFKALKEFAEKTKYTNIGVPTHGAILRFMLSFIDRESAAIPVDHTEIIYITYNTETEEFKLIERIKNDSR